MRKMVLASVVGLAALGMAQVAAQGGRVSVKSAVLKMRQLGGGGAVPLAGPVIRVPYDRIQRKYIAIDEKGLALPITLDAQCDPPLTHRIAMTLDVAGAEVPVSGSGLSKSGRGFSGTKTIQIDALTTGALVGGSVPNPVAQCNADLDAFVSRNEQGKAQDGWGRRYDSALLIALELQCEEAPSKKQVGFSDPPRISRDTATARLPVWIHCDAARVFAPSAPSRPPARRSSEVTPVEEPQRVPTPPQRTGGQPAGPAGLAKPAALPDLVIVAAQTPPSAPSKLRTRIANQGNAASPATSVTARYERGGKVVSTVSAVPALKAGETRWITIDIGGAIANATHLTLRIDEPGGVMEQNEQNNGFAVK